MRFNIEFPGRLSGIAVDIQTLDQLDAAIEDTRRAHGIADDVQPTVTPIKDAPPPPPVSLAVAAPPAPPVKRDRDASEWVDAAAETRIHADIERARKAGFNVGTPRYAVGTVVNSLGVANARASRADHDALPTASVALSSLVARVEAEARADEHVRACDLRMLDDGRIGHVDTTDPGRLLTIERDGLGQLCSRLTACIPAQARPAGLGAYLGSVDPWLRSANFNHHAEHASDDETIVLRTRRDLRGEPGRVVYASVSDSYAAHDADETARVVLAAVDAAGLSTELRARVDYDGRRTLIDLEAHSPIDAESYAAGEIYRAGVRVRTDDTGGGSLGGSAFIGQNLCRNLIILHTGNAAAFTARHTGDPADLARKLREGMRGAILAARVFADQWSGATRDVLPGMTDEQIKQASDRLLAELLAASLAGAVARDLVPVGNGTTRQRVTTEVPRLLRMWADDASEGSAAFKARPDARGLTRAAVVNATTRYAHKLAGDAFEGDELERAGGVILAGGASVASKLAPASKEDFAVWGCTPKELVQLARIL